MSRYQNPKPFQKTDAPQNNDRFPQKRQILLEKPHRLFHKPADLSTDPCKTLIGQHTAPPFAQLKAYYKINQPDIAYQVASGAAGNHQCKIPGTQTIIAAFQSYRCQDTANQAYQGRLHIQRYLLPESRFYRIHPAWLVFRRLLFVLCFIPCKVLSAYCRIVRPVFFSRIVLRLQYRIFPRRSASLNACAGHSIASLMSCHDQHKHGRYHP